MYLRKFPSRNLRAVVTMELKNKCRPRSNEEKNVGLSIFYKSPTTYNFLRGQKVSLPAPSTIRRWIGRSKLLYLSKLRTYT